MSSEFDYSGRRVVITGGATGIGAALVELLKTLGAPSITVIDLKAPSADVDAFIEANLSVEASVDAAIAAIDGSVDVLFNNAGVAATQPPLTVMSVNYLAARKLTLGLLPQIPTGGTVVNTASMAGQGWPANLPRIQELLAIPEWSESLAWLEANDDLLADVYGFSKQVAQVFTMDVSRTTIANGVRTNSVCPGPVQTPLMTDFKATMGEKVIDWTVNQQGVAGMAGPTDVAPVLAFLGSRASRFMNGTNLLADGGFTAGMTVGKVDFSGLA
jgi:NAD(P)-dependent dehydrogenase (short-subunit alcohol dehydrogenase family)